jgi:lipopolysaccharide export system permease protein
MLAARMTRIDRYVLRQLLVAVFALTFGLVAIIWLTQSLRFVELVVNRGLSFIVFLKLTGLLIPNLAAIMLPISGFVAVQFVYQRLAGDREVTVMRAAGLSPWSLSRPALGLALMIVICGYALNIWVVPAAFNAFREFQFEIRNRVAAFLLQEGVFTQVSDDLTVYVRARDPDGTLRGILIDDARVKTSHATILAESGRLISDAAAPRVLLLNGTRQELDHSTGRLNVLNFAENTIDLTESTKGDGQRLRDPTEMSIAELLHPAAGSFTPRDIGKLQVEAHRRMSAPLSSVGFILIALVSVLMGVFRRHGGLLRPFGAVMMVVALVGGGLAVNSLAARETVLLPLVWAHAVLPAVIAAWLLFGAQLRLMPQSLQSRLGVT